MATVSGWKRSSYCETGACAEVMDLDQTVLVRNSGSGRQVEFTRREWRAFLAGVLAGEFDLPEDG